MEAKPRKWKRRKNEVRGYLEAEDFAQGLSVLLQMPPRQVINPLISLFLSSNDVIRWRAIIAAGQVVVGLAEQDMEGARVIMRRFMWMLNDESGGIGWGVPEAMGEVVACHDRLGQEFADLLVSYVCPERNYLEYEALQRGALWAVGRVAGVKKNLLQDAVPCLIEHLDFEDAAVRGMAVRAIGLMGIEGVEARLQPLLDDDREVSLFVDNELTTRTIRSLTEEALSRISDTG